jgi:hypothetical protein
VLSESARERHFQLNAVSGNMVSAVKPVDGKSPMLEREEHAALVYAQHEHGGVFVTGGLSAFIVKRKTGQWVFHYRLRPITGLSGRQSGRRTDTTSPGDLSQGGTTIDGEAWL